MQFMQNTNSTGTQNLGIVLLYKIPGAIE